MYHVYFYINVTFIKLFSLRLREEVSLNAFFKWQFSTFSELVFHVLFLKENNAIQCLVFTSFEFILINGY